MADFVIPDGLNDYQVLNRFIRDHGEAGDFVIMSARTARRLALAAQHSLDGHREFITAFNRIRGLPPPRPGTYEETYGEPEQPTD